MLKGRKVIYTDVEAVTNENIISVLRKAYGHFATIQSECNYLINYEKGDQPLQRVKTVRPEIDCLQIDNLANEISDFKIGFEWSNPITFIQRGEVDSGQKNEKNPIALLNEQYETAGLREVQQKLARYVEICGIGYTFIWLNEDYEDGDAYFTYDVLDPRFSFVVHSSRYVDHRPMLGVSVRIDEGGNRYFTAWTKDKRFEIKNMVEFTDEKGNKTAEKWSEGYGNGTKNRLGIIPIVEWVRAYDRMGCFERQIPSMDNLNLLESDYTNGVENLIQAVWHCNDVDFPTDDEGNVLKPSSGDWLQSYTTANGKTPFVTPLTMTYDFSGMLSNIITQRSLILQKANVPQRNDSTGGSTGVAMSDATGWTQAESVASKGQNIKESCKIAELKVVLKAINISSNCPKNSPLKKLKYTDAQPNIKRQKSYELTVKTNALATLLSHGTSPLHAYKTVNLFDDPNQVVADSEEYTKKYLDSIFKSEEKESPNTNGDANQEQNKVGLDINDTEKLTNDDVENIVNNSPNVDGMGTSTKDNEKENNEKNAGNE